MTKRETLIRLMAVAGGVCLFAFVFLFLESRESKTRRYFSDKERVSEMTALYHQLDSAPPSQLGLIELAPDQASELKFAKSWKVPRRMVPKTLARFNSADESPYLQFGNVVAHYDADEKLAALEFFSSRSGCFVHRDPELKLRRTFDLPIKIRTEPPFITAWADSD